jgi:hypothetical protein
VGIVAIVLLGLAALVVVGAEWPRISGRFGGEAIARRSRVKRKRKLTVVPSGPDAHDDTDDFARSVERDLANLPVIEESDRS